jgi:anti-sigma-K factor RskA
MMAHSEDDIALAAEYALGTLDAGERAQVEAMMAADGGFAAIVQGWEYRLGALNQMVGSVEPRPVVWDNIKAAIGSSAQQAARSVLPAASPVTAAPEPVIISPVPGEAPPVPAPMSPVVDNSNIVRLSVARANRWRNVASVASALAACLVALLAAQLYRPELLPVALRPQPVVQTVEVKTPAELAAQYVALLQRDATSPAFILTVDAATKNFTIRKVGAQAEPGKSFELWLVSDQFAQPRSLGVIGGSDFTARPVLSGFDARTINNATYAVTVEPAGGSPTGQPTTTPIYTGKLIETVPGR